MDWWNKFLAFLTGENKNQIEWLLGQANKWRKPTASKYLSEVARRRDYINGEMEDDGVKLLKQEFPKLWTDMQGQMVQYPIAQFVTDKRAQVFRGRGARFFARDSKTDKEVPSDSDVGRSFDWMIKSAQLDTALVDINKAAESAKEVAGKVWWDTDHLEISAYWPDLVHVAVNPDRPWDPHTAFAVLFEKSGYDGVNDDPRYEIWGTRDPRQSKDEDEVGRRIFHPTVHYEATLEDQIKINDADENPLKSRSTRKPIMPFTWFRTYRGDLYSQKGGDELTRLNRVINLGTTWLQHHLHWQMTSVPTFEVPAGQTKLLEQLKGTFLYSPKHAMNLPPGVSLKFVTPDSRIEPVRNTYEFFIQYLALMYQLSPKHLDIKGGLPASGIALRLELDGLVRHNDEMTKILRPQVFDLGELLIVFWNLYAPRVRGRNFKAIPDRYVLDWDPGQFDSGPTDYVEIGTRFDRECTVGVSSYADWAMAVHAIKTRKEAEERIRANLEFNAEIDRASTRYPDEPDAAARAAKEIPTEGDDKAKVKAKAGDGVEGADIDKIVANVYQIVKAIEVGAATAVDLRQALYPDETRAQAETIVRDNVDFNREMAELIAEVRAVEAAGPPSS